jgi:hypothetical protein
MLPRAVIAAPVVALALAAPAPAGAVPVPMAACAPGVVAPGAAPCLPADSGEEDALAAIARSGADVLWRFWAAIRLF